MTTHTTTTRTADLRTYRAVHVALRQSARAMADAAPTLDTCDPRRLRAFRRYWTGYAGEVLAHHTVEDELVFPALIDRVPVAAGLIATTDDDHHRLDVLMRAATTTLEALLPGDRTDRLAATLGELSELMDRHLDLEDADILPLIERHVDEAEYRALEEQAHKRLGIGRQAAFSVPFIARVLSDQDRREILATAPMPFRMLYRATRPGYERLHARALGAMARPVEVTA